ncbi:TPA: hypothetical protein I8271_001398 [Kluyvera intermedia]|uniref:Uncharacterized protein n=1 Tax=Kluyvera intermedia TaxID=61648 RepID=A0A9P3TEB9_KLUIN|nr:hypothetical protein [Phytobacter ursingii]HAT2207919.1 hypothetical protein [Kluyvera intermedia]HAT2518625.1 hypothetical protein [Kluyvera intermedia]HAT2606736.1 hypothetical protein [Kluyvera intermedia]HAT2611552.1 hypothetical protein [Kluyvera intermedia]HAT2683471.1 hypothetical protein [Kluyvera intermedia]
MFINRVINAGYAEKVTQIIRKALAQYPCILAVLVNTYQPDDRDIDIPASVDF